MTLSELQQLWIAERPHYEKLAQQVEVILGEATRQRGIICRINSRAKAVDSLLKKSLKKAYENPYEEIQDKAGVRAVCKYKDFLSPLEEVVRERFIECGYQNKALGLSYDQLGYQAIHFEVKLRPEDIADSPELADKVCELQLLTEGQALWADVSHDLVYKPAQEPPDSVKRRVLHQVALLQLFDEQMVLARAEALSSPGFKEAAMLEELEKHFYRFTAQDFDREISLYILDVLKPLFRDSELDGFEAVLDEFVTTRRADLAHVFEQYAAVRNRSPLLFQPEIFAIFLCLDRDQYSLKEAWGSILPLVELQTLADIWDVDIGNID